MNKMPFFIYWFLLCALLRNRTFCSFIIKLKHTRPHSITYSDIRVTYQILMKKIHTHSLKILIRPKNIPFRWFQEVLQQQQQPSQQNNSGWLCVRSGICMYSVGGVIYSILNEEQCVHNACRTFASSMESVKPTDCSKSFFRLWYFSLCYKKYMYNTYKRYSV